MHGIYGAAAHLCEIGLNFFVKYGPVYSSSDTERRYKKFIQENTPPPPKAFFLEIGKLKEDWDRIGALFE